VKEETSKQIAQWATKLEVPVEELTKQFDEVLVSFKATIAGQSEDWYEAAALRRLYIKVKSDLVTPARPFDYISLGYSGTLDVTAGEREMKLAAYHNVETRDKTIAEGKVQVIDGVPTAIDTREWMRKPDPSKGTKGLKNRNYGKPLVPVVIRTVVGYGRPSKGGDFKLISVLEVGEMTKSLPPIKASLRSRFNLREERPHRYDCNASRRMKFDPIQLPEYPTVSDKSICDVLMSAPAYHSETNPSGIKVPHGLLRSWHDAHDKDTRRLCIIVGDVTVKPPDPISTGNYIVVIEDPEEMNFEAEGTPIWVPGELEEQLDFAQGSRVVVVGRTNIGPGRNPDTGQIDASIERVQINACAIFAIPEYRIAPERLDEYIDETAE